MSILRHGTLVLVQRKLLSLLENFLSYLHKIIQEK